ncbi:phosphopantetheine--protein transferase domain-containing protein [Lachnospiraceae bacterium]|nr:phosphopantetheine--protein transferase domain-containing protein [Lachnospiraceae bacterium]
MNEIFWTIHLTSEYKDKIFRQNYRFLPKFRKEKADRIRSEEGKRVSILAGMMLWDSLNRHDLSWDDMVIRDDGKPEIKSGSYFFSLSHKQQGVLLAESESTRIGADIERVVDWNASLAARFFSEKENDLLNSLAHDPKKRSRLFFFLWTAKEAYGKMLGGGLKDGLKFDAAPYGKFVMEMESCETEEDLEVCTTFDYSEPPHEAVQCFNYDDKLYMYPIEFEKDGEHWAVTIVTEK